MTDRPRLMPFLAGRPMCRAVVDRKARRPGRVDLGAMQTIPGDSPASGPRRHLVRRRADQEADVRPFYTPLHEDIHRFITTGQGAFADLAWRVFAYQFERNPPYRRLCLGRGVTPESLEDWRSIPAAPTTAFKHLPLACRPPAEAEAVFLSSGTTGGPHSRSRHFVFDLRLYHAAVKDWFAAHLLPDRPSPARILTCVLLPSPSDQPTSSLAHMLGFLVEAFGSARSGFFLRPVGESERFELEDERLVRVLADAREPVMLLGASYSFVHLLDVFRDRGLGVRLPAGSRLMDTGGFKGRSREFRRQDLYRECRERLGVPLTHCVNEYGMSEMLSQFYDRQVGEAAPTHHRPPPWVRTRILDPETLNLVPGDGVGVLRHWDLANIDSVMVLQTEDLGRPRGDGFQLLGRAARAEAKGCSLLVEEWLGTPDDERG